VQRRPEAPRGSPSQVPFSLTRGILSYSSLSPLFSVNKAVLQAPKHGLLPPAYDSTIHLQRCLMQLRSQSNSLEKYIYLSHLKNDDAPTFYKLCLQHMPELTPIIYTPTVGDACLNFSRIYRHPEGLVRI